MRVTDQERCQEWVYGDGYGRGHACGRPIKAERGGKKVCGVHRAAYDKREANAAERKEKERQSQANLAKARECIALLEELGIHSGSPFYSGFSYRYTGYVTVDGEELVALIGRLREEGR